MKKLALMSGTALTKAFIPLPGGATAVYNSSGLAYYRHTDHLGSSRFASTPTQTLYADVAYSPFGEPYASSGAIDNSFTGQNQDTTAGLYDFLFREYDPNQARWTSPDPAGLAAVDPSDPQSWNRYGYVANDPLASLDPMGLCPRGHNCLIGPACENTAARASGACGPMPSGACDTGSPLCGGWQNFYDPFSLMMIGYTPPQIIGWQLVGFLNGDSILGGCDPADPSCFNNEFPIYGPPSVPSVGMYQAIVVTPDQGQSTLDARANALANAISATHVQSLGNPCTVVAFYGTSAVLGAGGGAAVGGEAAGAGAAVVEKAAPYWPAATAWLYSQAMRGFPIIRFIDNRVNQLSNAVQSACNALQ